MKCSRILLLISLLFTSSLCFGKEYSNAQIQELTRSIINKNIETETALELLKKISDPNVKTPKGVPLLCLAAYHNRVDLVKALIEKDVNPDLEDRKGRTALFMASARGYLPIVKELTNPNLGKYVNLSGPEPISYSRRADLNAQDKEGYSPLHMAVSGGHQAVVEELLSLGANIDVQLQVGATPLMQASHDGNLDLVRLLVSYNADPSLETNNGMTALKLASARQHHSVVEFLKSSKTTVSNPEFEKNRQPPRMIDVK